MTVKLSGRVFRSGSGSSASGTGSAVTLTLPTLSMPNRCFCTLGKQKTSALSPLTQMSPSHSRLIPMPSSAPR